MTTQTQTEAQTQAKRILIVDDEPDLVYMAKRKLERSGYEVDTAANGQEGMDILKRKMYDLIVTDVVMPVMDGFTFYKNLKDSKATAGIPVIILTARANMEDSFKALGVDEFLAKPFDGQKLLDKIERFCRNDRLLARQQKVFICGSDDRITKTMQQILEDVGAEAKVFSEGLDLIKRAHAEPPNLILLDISLHGLKSPELIKALRSFGKLRNTHIVTFTQFDPDALGDVEAVERLKDAKNDCMIAGADKYIGRFSSVSFLDSLRDYNF